MINRHVCVAGVMWMVAWSAASQGVPAEAMIPVPGKLKVEGVPALPKAIEQAVERYTEFRGAGPMSWHPFERGLIIRTRFGDVSQAHFLAGPKMDRTQLTFFPEGIAGASFPRHTADYLIVSADLGGSEFNQLYRFDLATRDITLLTDGKSRNSGGSVNRAGLLAHTSTRRTGKDNDLYVIDPMKPAEKPVAMVQLEGGGWGVGGWAKDETTLLLGNYLSVASSELWLINGRTGEGLRKVAPLSPSKDGTTVSYDGGIILAGEKTILTTSDRDSEFSRLVLLDIATGAEDVLTGYINWDISSYTVNDEQTRVAFIANEAGRSVLRVMDLKTRKLLPLPGLPAGEIGGVSFRPPPKVGEADPQELLVTLNSSKSPGEIWSILLESGEVVRWTTAEGAITTNSFVEPELLKFKSFDGLEVSAWAYKPDPAKFPGKRPVYLSIHGGPEGQARPGFQGRLNYLTNELGIAVIYPNVRGSTGFGKTFVSLDNGFKREDSVKDIGALLDFIAKQEDLDASRVCVTGGSYGGYMTLAVATNYPDRIRCGIASVGISNFVTFLENTQAYRRDLRRVEYGDERDPAMREHLTKISPLTNVAKITAPMMIVQGANDPRVPASEAEQIVASLKGRGQEVWYLLGLDEGHGFAKKPNQDYQFYSTIAFLKKHLLGDGGR